MTKQTARKITALIEIRSGAPSVGRINPPKAGPKIPAIFTCTPPSVTAEGSSSLLTILGTIALQTGALKAMPTPSANTHRSTQLMLKVFVHAPKARNAVKAACQAIADKMTFLRFSVSAMIPAGNAKRSKGVEVAVAINESEKEAPRSCSSQVAVTSCAERNVAEKTVAIQILRNVGFLRANHVEVESI